MAMKTRICDLFGIEVPVLLAGMGGASTPELAAAVSNAGVPTLEKLTSLRELFLARTAVDEVGITQLQKALPRTRIVSAAD